MTTFIDTTPGMYLLGRKDGSITEFLAKRTKVSVDCAESARIQVAKAMVEDDDWWWKRMDVPDRLPSQDFLDSLPDPPMARHYPGWDR